jgi:hypothetical protein
MVIIAYSLQGYRIINGDDWLPFRMDDAYDEIAVFYVCFCTNLGLIA